MKARIVLDRDGVINQDRDDYVRSVADWLPLPGSIAAMAALSQAGHTLFVATNQSGIARGYYDLAELTAMHDKMRALVRAAGGDIADVVFCPHGPDADCSCRKPRPGLIDQLAERHGSLQGAYMVGDSLRDLQAGQARGLRPVLVRTGKGSLTEAQLAGQVWSEPPLVYADLAAFAHALLTQART